MERTSLFKVSRVVSLFLSPPSLQTDLSGETWGGKLLEVGVGEVCGATSVLQKEPLETGLEQGYG